MRWGNRTKWSRSPGPAEESVKQALALFQQVYSLTPEQEEGARIDFLRLYIQCAKEALRGAHWDFDGCMLCATAQAPEAPRLVMLSYPAIVQATRGRGFGALLCGPHELEVSGFAIPQDRLVAAVLDRLVSPPGPFTAAIDIP